MARPITAGLLYDYAECPHRVALDAFGPAEHDSESGFVKLLWRRAVDHRRSTLSEMTSSADLRSYGDKARERFTRLAMARQEPLILGARLVADDLIAEPDLLRFEHGSYVPGLVKTNRGKGEDVLDVEAPYKFSYALQLAISIDVLEHSDQASTLRKGFVWDVNGKETAYWLNTAADSSIDESWWDRYQAALRDLRRIIYRQQTTEPAWRGACKLCHWHTHCAKTLAEHDDLTLIPALGEARRTALRPVVETITEFAAADLADFGKIRGIRKPMLQRLHERAQLQKAKDRRPYLKQAISLPRLPDVSAEIYFDLEADPFRDLCYLHGFTVRDPVGERYTGLFADGPEDEEAQFAAAVKFMLDHGSAPIYHYSAYEPVYYKKLAKRYSNACSPEQLAALLVRMVDLYPLATEAVWPTRDHSIKTLARYLGFEWEDADPSGASSVEWFDQWIRTGDQQQRERIILYNEDDCVAMRVLADGLVTMRIGLTD